MLNITKEMIFDDDKRVNPLELIQLFISVQHNTAKVLCM